MKFSHTRSALSISFLVAGLGLLGGCAMLLGIEERKDGPAEDGPADILDDGENGTGLATTELCIDYCDEVMGNCTGENAQYAARESCINTCNALPPGTEAEPLGNNIQCRLVRAKGAGNLPDEECVAAGPGGGNRCGSNCETWCALLESECNDDFVALDDCSAACATIPDDGGFSIDVSYDRPDIQCRIIHLGAVAQDEVHCNHARYVPQDFCAAPETGEPDCSETCDIIMGNCQGPNAVYESEEDCLAACAALPLGDLSDRVENTVGCRQYHGGSGALDPTTHCDHAGPTGDGHCGTENEDTETGPCNSYCTLMAEGCPTEFAVEFPDAADCPAECATQLEDAGAGIDTFYTVETARDEDGLQCRVYYVVKALAGDPLACSKATLSGTCN